MKIVKKILLILLSVAFTLCLVGCGDNPITPSGGGTGGTGGSGNGTGGGTGGGAGGGQEPAPPPIYQGTPNEDEWHSTRYGSSANIWDSYILPDFMPSELDGVIGDPNTYYTAKTDEKYGRPNGEIWFANDEYEYYELSFYGQNSHLIDIIEALEAEDFVVSASSNPLTDDYFHCYRDDYYVYMRSRETDDEEGCERYFDIFIYPDQNVFPTTFDGVPLPQFGYCMSSLEYDDEEHETYPLTQTPTGVWIINGVFYMVTEQDFEAYCQALESAGFTQTSYNTYQKGDYGVAWSYYSADMYFDFYASNNYMYIVGI